VREHPFIHHASTACLVQEIERKKDRWKEKNMEEKMKRE
jgi:hypothetical protein